MLLMPTLESGGSLISAPAPTQFYIRQAATIDLIGDGYERESTEIEKFIGTLYLCSRVSHVGDHKHGTGVIKTNLSGRQRAP
jgi:hypothetical protein